MILKEAKINQYNFGSTLNEGVISDRDQEKTNHCDGRTGKTEKIIEQHFP